MTSPILLTGGTGTLGRQVVPLLRKAGREVRVLSRHGRPPEDGVEFLIGDLDTGDGVDAALRDVDTVVHCAGSARDDAEKARVLVRAADRAGRRPHIVNISVVGADRVPVVSRVDRAMFGYFAAQREAELVLQASGLPWTNLRATQFHDLILMAVRAIAKLPVVPVPAGVGFQPIDAGEVAARLVELALDDPVGPAPDVAGPRVYRMDELVRGYLRAAHKRRLLLPMRLPGRAVRAIRAGANLAPDRAVGVRTWEQFLADHV